MAIHKPSASSLERAIACPPSTFIPIRVSGEAGDPAKRGTAIHGFSDRVLMGMSRENSLDEVPEEYKEDCTRISTQFFDRIKDAKTEESYAVDFITGDGRYLGNHLDRNYPTVELSEFTGTLDIVGKNKVTGMPMLADIKSGQMLTPAKDNWQIKFLAYAAHKVLGYEEIECSLIYVREDEEPIFDTHIFTNKFGVNELTNIGEELKKWYKDVLKEYHAFRTDGDLHLREGNHCAYCPVALSCPAKIAAINALAGKAQTTDLARLASNIERLSPELAAQAWVNYKKIKNYYTVAEKSLKDYARSHGIPLPNGKKVMAVESSKASINVEKLVKLSKKQILTQEDLDSLRERVKFTKVMEVKQKKE